MSRARERRKRAERETWLRWQRARWAPVNVQVPEGMEAEMREDGLWVKLPPALEREPPARFRWVSPFFVES